MSFLTWRLLQGWLPVDEVLKRNGVSMTSKCMCCEQLETLEHVFFTNPVAVRIWAHFAEISGIKHLPFTSVQQILGVWSLSVKVQGHIMQVLPLIILWGIMEDRNKAKPIKAPYTIHSINARITALLAANAMANMQVNVKQEVHLKAHLYSWNKPQHNTLNLNVDASYKRGKTGYGGINRDHNGDLIYAIGRQGTNDSPLTAKLDALLLWLQVCQGKRWHGIQVKTDSLMQDFTSEADTMDRGMRRLVALEKSGMQIMKLKN
ncbi:hypothetical protein LIER_18010 [Lithospermum erythrorhizon]|uniref:Uncharacterized protein n=1 Tax=Lithospermum erythrorhizon TaxID=34254 RepID=A0AAV3QF16_LITER